MLKAVIFDLDNTLVNFWDFKKSSAKAAAQAMVEAGLEMTPERAEKLIFSIYEQHGIEYQLTFTELLKPFEFGREKFRRVRDAAITAYLKNKGEVLKPYEGVPQMLKELKKSYRLAVLTDAPRAQAHQRLEFAGLKVHFDEVGTFHDTNVFKPGVEPFLHICKKLDVEPAEALMVGDHPRRDIGGAKKAGMKTCLAKYGQCFEGDGSVPDFVVERPEQLLDVVRKMEGADKRN